MDMSQLYEALLQYIESENYQEIDAKTFYRKSSLKAYSKKRGALKVSQMVF